jgi:two-component system chemotaxis response regulator CheY
VVADLFGDRTLNWENSMSERQVLVVEDDPLLRNMYETILGDYIGNCAISVVADGATALDVFQSQAWELVITDLNMPGMNGRELYLKASEFCAKQSVKLPPFLFCSGVSDALDGVDAICESPGNAKLLKPFSMNEFQETVERLLSGQSV